jgi:hypothetical protein
MIEAKSLLEEMTRKVPPANRPDGTAGCHTLSLSANGDLALNLLLWDGQTTLSKTLGEFDEIALQPNDLADAVLLSVRLELARLKNAGTL